mgnify:CR=1 FL=1
MIRFNPRPREGATLPCLGDGGGSRCFNPRPREGATSRAWEMVEVPDVSIHAPVKGRPPIDFAVGGQRDVSIHAPVKGRQGANLTKANLEWFQSTPP